MMKQGHYPNVRRSLFNSGYTSKNAGDIDILVLKLDEHGNIK